MYSTGSVLLEQTVTFIPCISWRRIPIGNALWIPATVLMCGDASPSLQSQFYSILFNSIAIQFN